MRPLRTCAVGWKRSSSMQRRMCESTLSETKASLSPPARSISTAPSNSPNRTTSTSASRHLPKLDRTSRRSSLVVVRNSIGRSCVSNKSKPSKRGIQHPSSAAARLTRRLPSEAAKVGSLCARTVASSRKVAVGAECAAYRWKAG